MVTQREPVRLSLRRRSKPEPRTLSCARKFVRQLVGHGEVFGIEFRPGMFRPLCEVSVHALTDQTIPLVAELGKARLGEEIRSTSSIAQRAVVAERALQRVLPKNPPADALLARDLVDRIRTDSVIHGVLALWGRRAERPGLLVL